MKNKIKVYAGFGYKKYDVYVGFDFQDLLVTELSVKEIRDMIEDDPVKAMRTLFGEDYMQRLSLGEVAIEEAEE